MGLVRVEQAHRAVRLAPGDILHDGRHRGDADAGGDQNQRGVAVVQDHITGGLGDIQHGAGLRVLMQPAGDLAVRMAVHPDDLLDGHAQRVPARTGGDGVLPRLADALRQVHGDGHVLSGAVLGDLPGDRSQQQREDLVRLLEALHHAVRTPGLLGIGPGRGIQLGLLGDQCGGEEPVDLVPGGGDLRSDGLTQHLLDGAQQVAAHDQVLRSLDAQGDVLVGDALHHRGEVRSVRVDQVHGEGHHGGGQGLGLLADGLVGPVEDVEQFGVSLEHVRVEHLGDLFCMLGDDASGLGDDRLMVGGEFQRHGMLLGGSLIAGTPRSCPWPSRRYTPVHRVYSVICIRPDHTSVPAPGGGDGHAGDGGSAGSAGRR